MSLQGVSVVDLSGHPSGWIASHVLCDWGAEVWHVSGAREEADSFRLNGDDRLRRTWYTGLVEGKRVLDAADPEAAHAIEQADIVLVGDRGEAETQAQANPRAVVAVPTDFTPGSRYAHWVGSEMIHQALSGTMFNSGLPGKPPLYGLGHRAYYAGGWTMVIAVMGALLARDHLERGQIVEVSVFEACAAMAQNLVSQYSYTHTWPTRLRYDGMVSILRCSDGWIALFAFDHWSGICEAFDLMELIDDPRFNTVEARNENWPELEEALQVAARTLECERVVEIAQRRKVAVSKVNSVADLVDNPYFSERLWANEGVLRPSFIVEDLDPSPVKAGTR